MTQHRLDPPPLWHLPLRAPLLPLPDKVVMPGFPAELEVFEPRYLELVADLLSRPQAERWLALPRLGEGWSEAYFDQPDFHPVASLARLISQRPTGRGHLKILVVGLARVRLTEVASARAYRLARVRPWPDVSPAPGVGTQVDRLFQACVELMAALGPASSGLHELVRDRQDPERLVYRLASVLIHDPDERQACLEQRDLSARIQLVMAALTRLYGVVSCRELTKRVG